MPTPLLKSLAKKHGLKLSVLEGYWNDCQRTIKPSEHGEKGYGLVTNCVKAKIRKHYRKGKRVLDYSSMKEK